MLTFFYYVRAFYSARSFVPFNGGKTFWLVMMVLRGWQSHHYPVGGCQRLWEGWLAVIFVFSLCRRRGAGSDRLPKVTQEGPVEHAFSSMNNDGPRNVVKTFVWDASIGSGQGSVDSMLVPWSSGWRVESSTCPMRKIRTECWTRHVSNGGVLCEAATCAFRGGPYKCYKESVDLEPVW